MIDPKFTAFVNGRIDAATMKSAGRQALRMLIMSLPTDDLLIPLSRVIHTSGISATGTRTGISRLAWRKVAAFWAACP